jgi:hypothetical protein
MQKKKKKKKVKRGCELVRRREKNKQNRTKNCKRKKWTVRYREKNAALKPVGYSSGIATYPSKWPLPY